MKSKPLIMGLVFVVLWSSAFTSAKIIVNHAPPLLALGVRFFLTGLFGLILFKLFYKKVSLTKNEWTSLIIFGICQNSIYLSVVQVFDPGYKKFIYKWFLWWLIIMLKNLPYESYHKIYGKNFFSSLLKIILGPKFRIRSAFGRNKINLSSQRSPASVSNI